MYFRRNLKFVGYFILIIGHSIVQCLLSNCLHVLDFISFLDISMVQLVDLVTQWARTLGLMLPLIVAQTSCWKNWRVPSDLRHHDAHGLDIIVLILRQITDMLWQKFKWILTLIAMSMDPDSNVHGANMGPISGRQDPGGPHVGPLNFAIWVPLPINRCSRLSAHHSHIHWFCLKKLIVFSQHTR